MHQLLPDMMPAIPFGSFLPLQKVLTMVYLWIISTIVCITHIFVFLRDYVIKTEYT